MKRAFGRSRCWRNTPRGSPRSSPTAARWTKSAGAFSQLESYEDGVGKIVICVSEIVRT